MSIPSTHSGIDSWPGNMPIEADIFTATKDDYQDIHNVNVAAFGPEGPEKAEFVCKLRQTKRFVPELSLTARHCEKIIGHILFYPIDILQGDNELETLSLALLSVLPEFQNKGIGGKLTKAGISKAKMLGFQSVIVIGFVNYYPRFGFALASDYGINATFSYPGFVFMAAELEPGALENANGVLHYPKEFDGI